MQTISNLSYTSPRKWIADAVSSENVILRGITALEYLQYFVGYIGENTIDVYSTERGKYSNVQYHVVDSYANIEYVDINGTLCSSVNQAVNDLLHDFDNTDEDALANALSNFYYRNNESFSQLNILPNNLKNFEYMREWAVEYYTEGS